MKHLTSISFLSLLLLAGCGQSSKDKEQLETAAEATPEIQSSSSGEPITLHARLDFVDASATPSINANRQLNASIYMETDVTREGSGANATYMHDSDDSRVQGYVIASGKLALNKDDVSSNETYTMHNEWSSLTTAPEGKFTIKLPEASLIGEGLSVGVEIEAPVSGTKKATISSKEQSMESEVTHSRPIFCASQTADKDVCTLTFTIDAQPTKAQNPAYESLFTAAQETYKYQGKKGPDGGFIMYSGLVPVYGATTNYNNGHFVTELNQQYSVNVDGGDMSQHIYLVVWSTKRGDKWQPEGLVPLKKPETIQ